jgi:hypothetical protein
LGWKYFFETLNSQIASRGQKTNEEKLSQCQVSLFHQSVDHILISPTKSMLNLEDEKCKVFPTFSSRLGEIQHNIVQNKNVHNALVDGYHVALQNSSLCLADLEKDAFQFKRDVVSKDENNILCMQRYFQSRILAYEYSLDRYRLRHCDLKSKMKALVMQKKQRENSTMSLHFLDFHQLQIETKKQTQCLIGRTKHLQGIKISQEKSYRELLNENEKCNQIQKQLEALDKAIAVRQRHLTKLNKKISDAHQEMLNSHRKKHDKVATKQSEILTLDMVELQGRLYSLQKDLIVWERKVVVAKTNRKPDTST